VLPNLVRSGGDLVHGSSKSICRIIANGAQACFHHKAGCSGLWMAHHDGRDIKRLPLDRRSGMGDWLEPASHGYRSHLRCRLERLRNRPRVWELQRFPTKMPRGGVFCSKWYSGGTNKSGSAVRGAKPEAAPVLFGIGFTESR
jgi:hypothetical protein